MLTVTVNATINAPLARVFDYVTTAKHWPDWHSASLSVTGDIDQPMQSGNRIVERSRINGAVGEGTWTVVEHIPLKRVVLSLSGTPHGNLRIAYGFEEDRREVRFSRSLILDFGPDAKGITEKTLEQQERAIEADAIRALARVKHILESARQD